AVVTFDGCTADDVTVHGNAVGTIRTAGTVAAVVTFVSSRTIACSGSTPIGGNSGLIGGRPSISGRSANVWPHFQQRLTAPSSSSPHLEHRTVISNRYRFCSAERCVAFGRGSGSSPTSGLTFSLSQILRKRTGLP